jgi:hypothetical protein
MDILDPRVLQEEIVALFPQHPVDPHVIPLQVFDMLLHYLKRFPPPLAPEVDRLNVWKEVVSIKFKGWFLVVRQGC